MCPVRATGAFPLWVAVTVDVAVHPLIGGAGKSVQLVATELPGNASHSHHPLHATAPRRGQRRGRFVVCQRYAVDGPRLVLRGLEVEESDLLLPRVAAAWSTPASRIAACT
ncbi:hypothetical protein [Micromonospora sp. NPDC049107]|uniref:hypothetical protein n=1 Tax=unclassified Micromonospora TaxID=2617518 RepID=UPI00340D23F8